MVTAFPNSINDGSRRVTATLACTAGAVGLLTAPLSFSTNDPYFSLVSCELLCTGTTGSVAFGFASNPPHPGPIEFEGCHVHIC